MLGLAAPAGARVGAACVGAARVGAAAGARAGVAAGARAGARVGVAAGARAGALVGVARVGVLAIMLLPSVWGQSLDKEYLRRSCRYIPVRPCGPV